MKKNNLSIILLIILLIIILPFIFSTEAKPNNIIFENDSYEMGDEIRIQLEAMPNPKGTNRIDGFLVNIFYGTDGVDYVENYNAKYIPAADNSAIISFRASKGDNYITVESWAFDAPKDSGGIPSEKSTAQIWINDISSNPIDNSQDENNNTPGFELISLLFILLIITKLFKK